MKDRWKTELSDSAVALRSVLPEDDLSDLEAFGRSVANAQIVALGESTHGTREDFQMKHRMIRYLVEKKGFRAFIIEATVSGCRDVNDYVLYGQGERNAALSAMGYWTWNTEEVGEMLDWMRAYNRSCPPGARCQFFGCDPQMAGPAKKRLLQYLERAAEKDYEELSAKIEEYTAKPCHTEGRAPIYSIAGYMELNRRRLVAASSPEEYEAAMENCRQMCQFTDFIAWDDPENSKGSMDTLYNVRDSFMADNVNYILSSLPRGTKVILWAHNMHIADYDLSWTSLGANLRRQYGKNYYALGFTFGHGGFQAKLRGVKQPCFLPAPYPGTWDEDLDAVLDAPLSFLDLRSTMDRPALREWSRQTKPINAIGAVFDDSLSIEEQLKEYGCDAALSHAFDAVIHIKETTAARPVDAAPSEGGAV